MTSLGAMLMALCLALHCTATAAFTPRPKVNPLGRRAALATAAAVVTGVSLPAFAEPIKDAALYEDEDHNAVGDAANYKPFVRIKAAGGSSSLLEVRVPDLGPRSVDDYIDCMWFKDANKFKVLAAEGYGSNGLSRDFSLRADTGADPIFSARIKSKSVVVPMIHTKKGGTWEGKPFTVN